MNISANLACTNEEVDQLLSAASRLLRSSPEFQPLMRDLVRDAAATSTLPP